MGKKSRRCLFAVLLTCAMLSGCSSGSKEVQEETITIELPGLGETSGIYSGNMSGAKPSGEGVFTSSDSAYKYDGEWKDGLPSGTGTRYIDGIPEAIGVFEKGKLIEPNRATVEFSDDDFAYVICGDYAMEIPKGEDWGVDYDPSSDTAVITPPMEGDLSTIRYGFVKSGSSSEQAKSAFEEAHPDYSDPSRISDFKTNSSFSSSTSFDHYRYANDTGIADLYIITDKRNDGSFYCSLETVDGVRDYTQVIRKMQLTWILADSVLEKVAKQQVAEQSGTISAKAAEGDWEYIEDNTTLLTAADIINFTTPNAIVRVRGFIDNIEADQFDLWIEKDGSYYRDDDYHFTEMQDDILRGDAVEVCIETYYDGSLHKNDGIIAIRKREESIPDIVEVYKSSCQELSFETIMRNPSSARGTVGKVTGTVLQVVETTDTHQKILVTTAGSGDVFEISYFKEAGADNVLEKDKITAYGIFYITDTYTAITGAAKTVPVLVSNYIDY